LPFKCNLRRYAAPLSGMQKAVGKNMLPSLAVPVSRIAMSMCTDELDTLYKKVKPMGVTMTVRLPMLRILVLTH
jgi:pyruvate dehydrogenase E2 component (dihydrolipoamide acetyltransferase)